MINIDALKLPDPLDGVAPGAASELRRELRAQEVQPPQRRRLLSQSLSLSLSLYSERDIDR